MASTKTRQRKLERDRYERKLVRQAQRQGRRRQVQAGIGAFLALALIGVGVGWLAGFFESGSDPDPLAQPDLCTWLPRDPADHPDRTDVGTPQTNPPSAGARTITLELDAGSAGAGQVTVTMDVAEDPCGAASMEHLASQGFFDETECHELFEGVALRCGDPSGSGQGGPSYAFYGDNLPVPPQTEDGAPAGGEPTYPAGTVAFGDTVGENGSQFLLFYEDYSPENPIHPLIGTMTDGLSVVEEIGAAGGTEEEPTRPAEQVLIRSLTVTDPAAAPTQ
ncbi:MAG: peptidylprolyl isomerase [Micromonosporaceae bacterium]|nr:peptidylprolyl isomerase [Micromonosporaceae bacterium]